MDLRKRTVGEVVRAAVDQWLELDFRLRPLTAEERRLGAEKLGAQIWGPVLERLGLLSEEERMQWKQKTKADLIAELQEARADRARLARRVAELEEVREYPDDEHTADAARWLAGQFVASMHRTAEALGGTLNTEKVDVDKGRDGLEHSLCMLARGYAVGIAVTAVRDDLIPCAIATHGGFSHPKSRLLLARQLHSLFDRESENLLKTSSAADIVRGILKSEVGHREDALFKAVSEE